MNNEMIPMPYFLILLLLPVMAFASASGDTKPTPPAQPVVIKQTMDLVAATKRAENWFNSVQSMQATFSQTNQNQNQLGRVQTGMFYLQRPNRFLWQYEMPTRQKIVSTGANVFFHDEDNGQVTQIPRSTPLVKLLNAKTVDFNSDDFKPLSATETKTGFALRLALMDDGFEEGQFTLHFQNTPLQLTRITMLDALGSTNTIRLGDVRTGLSLSRDLFKFTPPQYEEN